jgi:signal transduction histidine kinase
MRYPKIVAAQRLQTWLLVTALVSVFLTGLLTVDLTRNLRTVVISEANKALTNAVKELAQASRPWQSSPSYLELGTEVADQQLRPVSYEVLRSYPDVEGGYLINEDVVGHSFPTYTEPGSTLRQPPLEHQQVLSALAESRQTHRVASRVVQDQKDLVLVAVLADPDSGLAAWSLRRFFNFSDSSELNKRLLLVAVMGISLIAIGAVLRLSFNLQRGFEMIQAGLERLRTDVHYRLPDQNHELRTIVQAINTMADSRQKLEADLRREDNLRVIGRVVAGIAHEIRNPLNSIRLSIRLLAKRMHGQTATAEITTLITSEIDRLDSLLKSLLVFGAEEPEKMRRQPLQPVLDRTLALVKPHAEEHGVAIRVAAPAECEALVDANYLQQALMNLLLNAIDAARQNGEVDLFMSPANGHVEISVEDSGPGLAPEQQERIFEAFYTTKTGGTGLGLAVTKRLLEKMGATIESGKGSRGARFRVLLLTGERS